MNRGKIVTSISRDLEPGMSDEGQVSRSESDTVHSYHHLFFVYAVRFTNRPLSLFLLSSLTFEVEVALPRSEANGEEQDQLSRSSPSRRKGKRCFVS